MADSSLPIWFQVREWGQLLVALNTEKTKGDWSDALFVQVPRFSFLV